MSLPPGQDSGQPGFDWSDYVHWLVGVHGSLVAVAEILAARRGHTDRVETIERALRRLRSRGVADGGLWGGRALRHFGLPDAVHRRVRWMGQYHSRFTDLPTSLCLELLQGWDRPPVRDTPVAVWLWLGRSNVRLRRGEDATELLARAERFDGRAVKIPILGRSRSDSHTVQLWQV